MSYPNCGSKKFVGVLQDHKSDKLSEFCGRNKKKKPVFADMDTKDVFFFFFLRRYGVGSFLFFKLSKCLIVL
jgi:hypothetical protein